MQSIVRSATTAARPPFRRVSHTVLHNLPAAQRAPSSFISTRKMSLSFVSTPGKSELGLSACWSVLNFTLDAPAAVGPYNQAVKVGNLLFASGSLGIDPATGKLVYHLLLGHRAALIASCR